MPFMAPSFLSRLLRPFTSSTQLGISSGANGAATAAQIPDGAQRATIAAGCFWGVEHMYRRQFGGKGLYDARVGYIGGDTSNPSYRLVCSGTTGREYIAPFHDLRRLTWYLVF
jgi:peptide-methionine (S)-S-oxide reductase